LVFPSTAYEWLVCGGAKRQFKGMGTVNGGGSYGFLLTAIDGQLPGGGDGDRFRLKVWDRGTGLSVYDNKPSKDDYGDAATGIGGGSTAVHRGDS